MVPRKVVDDRILTAFRLENMLKNVTIRKLVHIREIKEKRSLKEVIKQILARQKEEEAKKRRKLKKKLIREYEDQAAQAAEIPSIINDDRSEPDILYKRVIIGMDRLLKVLTSHSAAVDSLEKKLNHISAPNKKNKNDLNQTDIPLDQINQVSEDRMNTTGGIEGFEGLDEDNLDVIAQSEIERDAFMDDLQGGKDPDEDILREYRMPVSLQAPLQIDADIGDLSSFSSEDSDDNELVDDEDKQEEN